MFLRSIGQGVAASFTLLGIAAVGNGISTYLLNGQTIKDVVASRFGGVQ